MKLKWRNLSKVVVIESTTIWNCKPQKVRNPFDATFITLYLVVMGISIQKSDELDNFNIQTFVSKK